MHRINAFIAQATGRSRRECDALVQSGRITVDGRPAVLNDRVGEEHVVLLDGERVQPRAFEYIAMNKPKGLLTAVRDRRGKTVCDLLPPRYQGVFPVGRLDLDTRGLLLLTNDGSWSFAVQHPSQGVHKYYEVLLNKPADIERIAKGAQLEDGWSKFAAVRIAESVADRKTADGSHPDPCRIEVVLLEGRKRQIRLTLRELGYRVNDLVRTRIGAITLGDLAPGAIRPLTRAEKESIAR